RGGHAIGNDAEAQTAALRALLVRPLDESRKLGERRGRGSHVRRHLRIGEQREQCLDVGCGELAKRGHVAMQRWHSGCPSVGCRSRHYFPNVAVQFSTTLINGGRFALVSTLMRKRCPSAETSHVCKLAVGPVGT